MRIFRLFKRREHDEPKSRGYSPALVKETLGLPPLQGTTKVSVIGESHYQDALSEICGGKTKDGYHLSLTATLQPEPANPYDPNAVGVHVRGLLVGYLPRELAAALHADFLRLSPGRPITCKARILGGWLRPEGDEGSFGVDLFFRPNDLAFSQPPS